MNKFKAEDIFKAIEAAIMETFGSMAFIDVICSDELPVDYNNILLINLEVPVHGQVALFFPLDLKRTIVENINGAAWEDLSIDVIDDCLLELLNIIAGLFLTKLFGEDVKNNLSFPQVIFDDSEIDLDNFQFFTFNAEEHIFKAGIKLEDG